jgi:hypothetical protein
MDAGTDHDTTIVGGQTGYAVPLIVAVTGHRDLVPDEVPQIRTHVRDFLRRLQADYPERGVTVMSSLAEGADQVVAEVALELGVSLLALLPMPRDSYIEDFETLPAREKFYALLARATEVLELPITPGNTARSIAEHGKNRTRQYAQLGVFLCAHCHILLALWDGKYSDKLGGTGQVIRFHHDNVMPGYIPQSTTTRLILADDESDLVYHIVCSRDRPDGQPAEHVRDLPTSWFTTNETWPRTPEMPVRHQQVLKLTSEFSADALQHEARIIDEAWSLIDEKRCDGLPAGSRDIDHVFRAADWLAIHFQKRYLRALRSVHVLALLMGFMYIVYSDVVAERTFIFAFVAFFVVAAAIQKYSTRHSWHRKYLDYRTLAEGLRVQFYWAVAGVTSGSVSKFTHDNFLQLQDSDLGWIRNVMRVAGMECNVSPHLNQKGLDLAVSEWVGDDNSGQLGYYRKKAREKVNRGKRVEQFAAIILWVSVAAFLVFAFSSREIVERVHDPAVILMGVLLLAFGVRQSYSFSVADFELIKQYEFMRRTFSKARRRIDRGGDDQERRRVLRLLGEVALEEHAEWILLHRERSVDEGDIWRITG